MRSSWTLRDSLHVRSARAGAVAAAAEMQAPPDVCDAVALAASELGNNAHLHADGGRLEVRPLAGAIEMAVTSRLVAAPPPPDPPSGVRHVRPVHEVDELAFAGGAVKPHEWREITQGGVPVAVVWSFAHRLELAVRGSAPPGDLDLHVVVPVARRVDLRVVARCDLGPHGKPPTLPPPVEYEPGGRTMAVTSRLAATPVDLDPAAETGRGLPLVAHVMSHVWLQLIARGLRPAFG